MQTRDSSRSTPRASRSTPGLILHRSASPSAQMKLLLGLFTMLSLLSFMLLHAIKADGYAPISWLIVFLPLIIITVAVIVVLAAAPFVLPRSERPAPSQLLCAILVALSTLFLLAKLGGLEMASKGWVLIMMPLFLSLLLQGGLCAHGFRRDALRFGTAQALGQHIISCFRWILFVASVALLLIRLRANTEGGGDPASPSWRIVAMPWMAALLLELCMGCAICGSLAERRNPAVGAETSSCEMQREVAMFRQFVSALCGAGFQILLIWMICAQLERTSSDGYSISGSWGGAYFPFALLLLCPLCCGVCCAFKMPSVPTTPAGAAGALYDDTLDEEDSPCPALARCVYGSSAITKHDRARTSGALSGASAHRENGTLSAPHLCRQPSASTAERSLLPSTVTRSDAP